MARRSDRSRDRDRSRRVGSDPVAAATPSRPSPTKSVAATLRNVPTSANRYAGAADLRLPSSSSSRGSSSSSYKSPGFVGYDVTVGRPNRRLERISTAPGKRSLDRGPIVRVGFKSPLETVRDASRRADKPKSAKAEGRTKKSPRARDTRSAPRDARVGKKGSSRLTDKNYKGYDATKGKPDKKKKDIWHCKDRPSGEDTKKSGGGGSRSFIPWC